MDFDTKVQIKEELKKNVSDWLLEDSRNWRKRWDLVLDLSAPQLIIPEHFVDKEATLLILDFGTLHVDNGVSPLPTKTEPTKSSSTLVAGHGSNRPAVVQTYVEEDEDEDEEFVTPASSLGSPALPSDADPDETDKKKINDEGEFRKRIYETYSIQLSDMQVIVGRLKDNWRQAQLKVSTI